MKQRAAVAILSVVSLILLTTSTTAGAAVTRLGGTINALPVLTRGSAVAFGNNVYLVVSAYGTVRGQLLAADGTPTGGMFVIQASANYTHFPRVGFSPHANNGQGAFLVTWHESDLAGGATSVHARLVNLTGALISADTIIGSDISWWEAGAAIAYATVSREFLVVWQRRVGSLSDISAARVSNSGALLANIVVSSNPDWERDPSVAYNPATDEFLVVYAGSSPVSAQRVKAGTGALLGGPITLAFAAGPFITDVAYNSTTNQFLASWYQDPPRAVYGRVVAADGSTPGLITPLSIRFRAYDALSLAFNSRSGTFLMTSHDSVSYDVGGVQITAAGQPEDSGSLLTAAGDAPNFYPMLAASTAQPEWMVVAAHNYGFTLGQRVGSGGSSPPPPPPPPACAVEPLPSIPSLSLTGAAQSQNIAVTASTADCPWTASGSASWITITAGASGAGPGTTTFAVARNTSGAARTGSVSVGSGRVTVQQAPSFGTAAVHDISGDRASDLIWHHLGNGNVAVWNLVGHTVTSSYYLTTAGVDTSWKVVGTGDLNGDDYADIVWRHAGGIVACWLLQGGQIAATRYLMMGTGVTAAVSDPAWEIRAVGDLDGDGKSDIIWQNMATGTLGAWFMDGFNVRLAWSLNLGMPDSNWKIAGAGDINGDGKADIVWQNHATGGLGAWLMNGNQVIGQGNLSIERVVDLNWQVRGVGDTNGDGFADVLWQNMATGGLAVWYLNNFTVVGTRSLSISVMSDPNWLVVGPG